MSSKSSSKKDGEERDSLVDKVFSWSLDDIFNRDLYKDKVRKIPETFSSVVQYLDSYRYPLLEETHADLLSNMTNLYHAPKCKILSVEKHKDYKPPRNYIYIMLLSGTTEDRKSDKDVYKPQASDIIAFSDVRPERVKDFVRVSYIPAMILHVDDEMPYLVQVLTSKPITLADEKGEEKLISDPLYAAFLINMTTNLRIWRALNPSDARNENIFKEVLRANSKAGVDCEPCSQNAELVLSKSLQSFNLNESQHDAVLRSIATGSCSHKSSVKLIWGPPGTGKTKTIGILLWALLKMKFKALTCAPTNTAVVEVTSRLMSIVRQTLESKNYGLGDIVLFGNGKRMKIDDHDDLLDVFLDYRGEILWNCLKPHTGWGVQLKSMICLLGDAYQQFLSNQRNKTQEKEEAISREMEQMEETDDETEDETEGTIGQPVESSKGKKLVNEEFKEFLLKRFFLIEKDLKYSIKSICSHMPTSFISVRLVNKMYTALDLLKFFRTLLLKGCFSNQVLKKVFSDSEIVDCNDRTTSALTLRKIRVECLEVLRSLEEFKFPNFPDARSIKKFCLGKARLIFCTASSSAKLSAIKELKLVIIDEAAQLKECESAIPLQLTDVKHAILIGDERQLPAMVQSKISEKADFGRSLFERLVSLGRKKHLLNIQYRMHPSISVFPNVEFYNKQIQDAPTVKGKSHTRNLLQGKMYGPFSFIDVSYGREEYNDMHSCKNLVEVAVISDIIENLYKASIAKNNKVSVGVISPYKAQVFALMDKLGDRFEAHSNFSVSVRSVDGFQGAEEDVIIMSTVRSNANGSVGFLSNHQRTNVALTRARHCLWILGNGQTLMNSDSVWRKLVQSAKDRGCYFSVDDDKRLSNAVIDAMIELNQLDDLLNMDSLLFKGAKWKVIFGDCFWSSLSGIKSIEVRKKLVSLLMKLSNGWRQRSQGEKMFRTNDEVVAQLLQRNQINGRLNLLWTKDIIKEKSNYIQVLKVWDIQPLAEIPRLAKSLEAIFHSYTIQKMYRCKYTCLEGVLEVPMSWEIRPDTIGTGTGYEDLSAALASLSLAKEPISTNRGSRGQSSKAKKPEDFRNKSTAKRQWNVVKEGTMS